MSLYDIQRTNKLSREDVYDMMKDIHGWRLEQHLSEWVSYMIPNATATLDLINRNRVCCFYCCFFQINSSDTGN
jgi:hypothetical protein